MEYTRRDFLKRTGYALGASALVSQFGMVSALAQAAAPTGDYKALVCIFLHGGNDAYNMVVPMQSDVYAQYAAARPVIALPQSSLLPITPANLGQPFGLHPSMSDLQTLWGGEPPGRAVQRRHAGRPDHARRVPLQPLRAALGAVRPLLPGELLAESGPRGGVGAGRRLLRQGPEHQPAPADADQRDGRGGPVPGGHGPVHHARPRRDPGAAGLQLVGGLHARYSALRQLQMLDADAALVRVVSDSTSKTIDDAQLTSQVLGAATVSTVFPTSSLGKQLLQIAKIISVRSSLGQNRRQIFFADIGGFDTHAGQLATHTSLYRDLSQSLLAFYSATKELGVADQVTSFTLSEFGRTFQNSGDGTDHAWGSHALILGDSVRGGNFYGRYPTLIAGGPDDVDSGASARGRFLPTTSVDQYAATLGYWFGLDDSAILAALPNIARFSTTSLGFMQ